MENRLLLVSRIVIRVICGKWCFLVSIWVLIRMYGLLLLMVVKRLCMVCLCEVLLWLMCSIGWFGKRICRCFLVCLVLVFIGCRLSLLYCG